jgi:hypothetical protein
MNARPVLWMERTRRSCARCTRRRTMLFRWRGTSSTYSCWRPGCRRAVRDFLRAMWHGAEVPGDVVQPGPVPDLPAGVWRHWKGHLYQVLGYATDSSIAGRTVVVYIGLELDGASPGPRMHVREAAEFTGRVEFNGAMIPRFEYLAPEWPGEVPRA